MKLEGSLPHKKTPQEYTRSPSSLNHRLSWSLQIADSLPHSIPIFSQVFDECRICGQLLTCYVEIHTDDPQ